MPSSTGSMREKLTPSRPESLDNLPYKDEETEYQDYTAAAGARAGDNAEDEEDDGESFEEYQYTSKHRPIRRPIYRQKKYWVICAVLTVIFLAIFIPIAIKYLVPLIAQAMMKSATMTVRQLNMTNPGETEMTVSVLASVGGIPKIFSASMEFTEQVEVSWDGKLIGSMSLGTVHVAKGQGDIQQVTTFKMLNVEAFGQFAKVMLAAEGFAWNMKSKATIKALGLTVKDLVIEKQLDMNGLNNFGDVKILSFDLPADAPDGNGALVSIRAEIPNPSPIGMVLGTITLDMFFKTAYLGRVTAKNVTLVGGQPMPLLLEGQLFKQTDPIHAEELSLLMSNYLGDIPTMAVGKGVSVFPDGVNAVSWLTKAITTTSLSVPLKSVQKLDVIKDISIDDLNLIMNPATPWSPTAMSNSVSATFKIPFNISINITELGNTTFKMAYQGKDFVELSTAVWNRTTSNMAQNHVVFTVPPSAMNIYDQAAFTSFLSSVTQQAESVVDVFGTAQGVAVTALGVVRLTVPLKASLPLKGINFANARPSVANIIVTGGDVNQVTITADVGLDNPSIFSVVLGAITFQVDCIVDGVQDYLGTASIDNLVVKPGMNIVPAKISFRPRVAKFGSGFLRDFIAGKDFVTTIYGDENTSSVASLVPTLKSLRMTTSMPGMQPVPQLIRGGNGSPSLGNILGPRIIPLTVDATNPLGTVLWIDTITASLFWKGTYFGGVDHAYVPFPVAAMTTMTSPVVRLQCPQGYQFALFLITQFIPANLGVLTGAAVPVDMTATLKVQVGGGKGIGYEAEVDYAQNGVPAVLKIDYSFAGMFKRGLEEKEDLATSLSDIPERLAIGTSAQSSALYPRGMASPSMLRKRLVRMTDQEMYANIVSLVGEEPPEATSGMPYVAWMEKALRSLYPEHQ